jgi:ketosteroid isomerase-like protein
MNIRKNGESGIDELKSTYQQTVDLYNSGRIDDYFDFIHDEVVYYAASRNQPIEGKTAVRAFYDEVAAQGKVHWELKESKYLVEGMTGVIWGTFHHTVTSVDGKAFVAVGRNTEVFTYSTGKWLKIYEHMSWFPVVEEAEKK